MLLYGQPVADKLFEETRQRVQETYSAQSYILFFLLSDYPASRVYVQKKTEYATGLGLQTKTVDDVYLSKQELIARIQAANTDASCVGMVIQLPLAPDLQPYQSEILCAVDPHKDIDGLGGTMLWLSLTNLVDFIPATPKAVIRLLDHYEFSVVSWKTITIIGQSNLIGKPLAAVCMDRGATVLSFNASSDKHLMEESCQASDMIVSATGVINLLTPQTFGLSEEEREKALAGKVIIDVGRGIEKGKAVGDTDRRGLARYGAHITPVPGGIWPVTVACLFHNLVDLHRANVR